VGQIQVVVWAALSSRFHQNSAPELLQTCSKEPKNRNRTAKSRTPEPSSSSCSGSFAKHFTLPVANLRTASSSPSASGTGCAAPGRCRWRTLWYNSYTNRRFQFDQRKSEGLRAKSERGIGFEEAQEIFSHPYYLDQRSDMPEQYRAIGWVGADLYALIFEVREDKQGEHYHLVTLWKATKQEQQLYEEHS
jgi:uncharacterized DUF497 family protein